MKPLTIRQIVVYSLLLAAILEGVTVFFRFGLGLEASKVTASTEGRLTGGIRLHHGYFGVAAILVAAAVWHRRPAVAHWLLVVGVALTLSDAVHHFLVLWPIVGSPQFDLVYPPQPR